MERKNIKRREGRKKGRTDGKSIMMPHLPGEIVDDILFMLPAKSICRFRCVCKQWCSLFKNPDFVKSRLKNNIETEKLNCFSVNSNNRFYMHITKFLSMSVFESDLCASVKMDSPFKGTNLNIELLGSCNGLILMRLYDDYHHVASTHWVWNPCTKELKEIVIPSLDSEPAYCRETDRSIVLGYNCDTDDYEIVVTAACYSRNIRLVGCRIHVYTLRSNSWNTFVNTVPYRIITSTHGNAKVIFVGGVVYWMAMKLQSEERCIVSFDIHGVKLSKVAVTLEVHKLLNDTNSDCLTLGVLNGCLCILRTYRPGMFDFHMEIWAKKDSNVKYSWTKLFIVKLPLPVVPNHMKLLWEFKNGDVLFVTTEYTYRKGENYSNRIHDWNCNFVIFDPVSQKCQVTPMRNTPFHRLNIEAYIERSRVLNSTG